MLAQLRHTAGVGRSYLPAAVILTALAAALLFSAGNAAGQSPPLPPPLPLGNPAGLQAAPGANPGEITLTWTPATSATIHWVWTVKPDGAGGKYTRAAGNAATVTIAELDPGQQYYAIIIAARTGEGNVTVWSNWSNWALAQASDQQAAPTPTPTLSPTPTPAPSPTPTPTPGPGQTLMDFQNGRWLAQNYPATYRKFASLPWVADGISAAERDATEWLLYTAGNTGNDQTLALLLDKPWVAEGVSESEKDVIFSLAAIGYYAPEHAPTIAAMPYLDAITPGDYEATRSLTAVAALNNSFLRYILAHQALGDGITDQWTPIIATMASIVRGQQWLAAVLLDAGHAPVTRRTVNTPLAGPVPLAIIRSGGTGPRRTMDLLELATRETERFMQEPMPASMIAMLLADTVSPGAAGANYAGTHIAIRPRYEDYTSEWKIQIMAKLLVHEVAHYYWRGNSLWIDEGMANLMEVVAENRRTGRPVIADVYPCPQVDTLAELDAMTPAQQRDAFDCHYSLGERLFLSLYRKAGDANFRRAVGQLYRDHHDATEADAGADAAAVFAAFAAVGHEADARAAYQHGAQQDLPGEYNPTWRLEALDANITGAWIGYNGCQNRVAGDQITAASAQINYLYACLKYEYNTNYSRQTALEMQEKHAGDGFTYYLFQRTLTAEPRYIGFTLGLYIGPGPGKPWRPGRHWFLYHDAQQNLVATAKLDVTT